MRRIPIAALLVLSVVSARPARAGDVAEAEALFREGRAKMDAGDYATACPKLAESFEQDPGTGALLALAMCRERAGQIASAWASYGQVASRSKREGRADREQAAREAMQALEPRLSHLTITVDQATSVLPGLVVKRDGAPVGSGAWGAAVPIDPGEHLIEASAPGKQPWSKKLSIGAEHDTQNVEVPALVAEPAAPAMAPVADSSGNGASTGPPLRTLGLAVGGAGVVGLGLGIGFGLHAQALNRQSNEDGHCNAQNQCDAVGGQKRDDAKSAATIATVGFVAGGVLAAAGVTLFVLGAHRRQSSATVVEATPVVGQRDVGLLLRGRF
jgi:hypothetical protein